MKNEIMISIVERELVFHLIVCARLCVYACDGTLFVIFENLSLFRTRISSFFFFFFWFFFSLILWKRVCNRFLNLNSHNYLYKHDSYVSHTKRNCLASFRDISKHTWYFYVFYYLYVTFRKKLELCYLTIKRIKYKLFENWDGKFPIIALRIYTIM